MSNHVIGCRALHRAPKMPIFDRHCKLQAFTLRYVYKPDFPQEKAIRVSGNGLSASVCQNCKQWERAAQGAGFRGISKHPLPLGSDFSNHPTL